MSPLLLLALALVGQVGSVAHASQTFEDWTYYVGDSHVHTGVSGDGGSSDFGKCRGSCGPSASVFADGRANGLDWMVVTDHANGKTSNPLSDAAGFLAMIDQALAEDDPEGGFIALPGAEVWNQVTGAGNLGHLSVMVFGDASDLAALTMADFQPSGTNNITISTCADLGTWMTNFEASFGPFLAIPHHTTALMPMATNWSCIYPDYTPAAEIYSEHGQSLTADTTGFDPMWSGVVSTGTVSNAIDPAGYGLELGFMAASDRHDTHPGDTCRLDTVMTSHPYGGGETMVVMDSAEEYSHESLYAGFMEHRTIATSGPLLPIAIDYSTGGAIVANLGGEIGLPDGQDLDIEVRLPEDQAPYVVEVSVVTPDGSTAMTASETGTWNLTIGTDDIPAWVYVKVEVDGSAWYGTAGCTDGGSDTAEWLWVSPSWTTTIDADLDGDGLAFLDGDCDDGDDAVLPGATEIWYDGIDQDCDSNDDDQDGDNFSVDVDCDDASVRINPGMREIWYDGIDQNCDGRDDDQDGDNFPLALDCDDTAVGVNPGMREVWYDGIDQNCDGKDDDQDGDNFPLALDCDDTTVRVNPRMREVWYDGIDQNCDGNDDDQDHDGFAYGLDCDDLSPSINPGMKEIEGDGVDQNCDGSDLAVPHPPSDPGSAAGAAAIGATGSPYVRGGRQGPAEGDVGSVALAEAAGSSGCSVAGGRGPGMAGGALLVGLLSRRRRAGVRSTG